jgi:hypothetical protein
MKFASREQKIEWLKQTAEKIQQMDFDRKVAILQMDFGKAYSLLRGLEFAKGEFRRVSQTLKK